MKWGCCAYTNLLFRFDKCASTGFRILVGALTVDSVLATWRNKRIWMSSRQSTQNIYVFKGKSRDKCSRNEQEKVKKTSLIVIVTMYEVHGCPLMVAVSSYRCSRVPASRGPATCSDTHCNKSVCWSASSSKYAGHPSLSSVGEGRQIGDNGSEFFQVAMTTTKWRMLCRKYENEMWRRKYCLSPLVQAKQVRARCSCLPSPTLPESQSHCHPHRSLSSCLWAPVTLQTHRLKIYHHKLLSSTCTSWMKKTNMNPSTKFHVGLAD